MDISVTDERLMLLDITRRWLAAHYDFDQRRKIAIDVNAAS